MNTRPIRIHPDDLKKLRTEVKNEFLKHFPEFERYNITDGFLLNKVIEYYLK